MLLGRKPRTRLDLIKPNTAERVEKKQEKQKEMHDSKAKARFFKVGDSVFIKNKGLWKELAARDSCETHKTCFLPSENSGWEGKTLSSGSNQK